MAAYLQGHIDIRERYVRLGIRKWAIGIAHQSLNYINLRGTSTLVRVHPIVILPIARAQLLSMLLLPVACIVAPRPDFVRRDLIGRSS